MKLRGVTSACGYCVGMSLGRLFSQARPSVGAMPISRNSSSAIAGRALNTRTTASDEVAGADRINQRIWAASGSHGKVTSESSRIAPDVVRIALRTISGYAAIAINSAWRSGDSNDMAAQNRSCTVISLRPDARTDAMVAATNCPSHSGGGRQAARRSCTRETNSVANFGRKMSTTARRRRNSPKH
jgi:hypothetical protein